MIRKKLSLAAVYLILFAVLIITLFPLFYTFMSSLKSSIEILTSGNIMPQSPSFKNYVEAWNSPELQVGRQFLNSVIYCVLNVMITNFVSSMAGYVFAVGRFRFKKLIFGCFTFLMFVKLGGISVYPTFEIFDLLHLPINLYGLIFVHLFAVPIVNMYLVKGFVNSIPYSLLEAATIDGCSFFGRFVKIIFPLLKPIIATITILAFQGSWNDYIMPTVFTLTRPEQRTLIVGLMALKSSGGAASSWHLMLAGTIISIIPVVLVYILCNKYFVEGITAGAEKG